MELESGGDQDVKLYHSVLTHVAHPGLNMSVDAQAQKYSVSTRQKSHVVLVCKSKPETAADRGLHIWCHAGLLATNRVWLERRHAFIYSSTFWEPAMRGKVNTLLWACRVHVQTCTLGKKGTHR